MREGQGVGKLQVRVCFLHLRGLLAPRQHTPTTQPTHTRTHTHTPIPINHSGVEPATCLSSAELHVRAAALVFLNGNILGLHRRPRKFVHAMR